MTAEGRQVSGARPGLLRLALVVLATALSSYATLLSFYGPEQVALAAPLAGVAVVVALTATPRSLPTDAVAVAATSLVTITLQVSDWRLGTVGAVTTSVQGAAVVLTYRLVGRWPGRGRTAMRSLGDVTVLGLAVAAAAVSSSALRWTGLGLIDVSDLANVELLLVRTVVWAFVGGALGALALAGLGARASSGVHVVRPRTAGPVEVLLGLLATATVLAFAFAGDEPLPVIFPLFLVVVWASLRLSALGAVAVTSLAGAFAVVCTVVGLGSFAQVDDARVAAILVQAFFLSMVVVALTLSLSVQDRDRSLTLLREATLEAQERSRERDLVLANLEEGVVLLGEDGTTLMRNEAAGRLLGDALPAVAGSGAGTVTVQDARGEPVADDLWSRAVADRGSGPRQQVLVLRPEHGDARTVEMRSVAADDSSGGVLVVVTLRDVTAQRRHTAELAAFAGVVAHDLARPLTVITGWAELLDSAAEDGEAVPGELTRRYTGRILGAASSMRTLLDDLLTLTLAPDRDLHPTEVDVSALCEAWTRGHVGLDAGVGTGRVLGAASTARVEVEDGIVARGDETLLRQLFENLLANAVKYVAPGTTPRVVVSRGPSSPDQLVVRVTDNGIGIPEAEASRVFDEFYRGRDGRDFQGTGIGLAICQRVVTRHGGSIRVTPGPDGTGSCFEVRLPTGTAGPQDADGADGP
ncbi:hypothetical protein GCM10009737_16680 [Nocardioides lentus]|uniref:Sensor-like histidine kinase SenX3 n=1 Tax=Nocardioides lentus TaxID=338077 RepID=A0ABP5AK75_9ACTN